MPRLLSRAIFAAATSSILWSASTFAHTAADVTADARLVSFATVALADHQRDIAQLVAKGYSIAGIDLENNTVDIILKPQHGMASLGVLGFTAVKTRTIDTRLAPDERYKTPAEVEASLRHVAQTFPDIVQLVSIGKTLQNRNIWALKISDNPQQRESDEPAILFNAMHHAREVMTVEVALDLIAQLTSRYGNDPRVTHWVDANEIWVIPQVNPDGNDMVWTRNNMWRKNTRGGYGVDINRNYPYGWASCDGSSSHNRADDYHGPEAASEAETQAVMRLVARTEPVFNISYHSYSELVLYPMGCRDQHTATRSVVEPIGRELAAKLVRDSGRGSYAAGTPWELLYSADGGDIDWMYAEHHVIPYVIEMNAAHSGGFQPPYRLAAPTVEKMRAGWQYLLDRLDQTSVRGLVTDAMGRPAARALITIENLARANSEDRPVTWKVKADASYHIVLNPGSYRLTFVAEDRHVAREVAVGAERVTLDVQL